MIHKNSIIADTFIKSLRDKFIWYINKFESVPKNLKFFVLSEI